MFGILDRYVGRTVIMAILMCTVMLVGLSSLIKFVDQLQNVGEGSFTTFHAILRVLYAIPGDTVLFFPMAALLGGVIGLGQLASSSELVVLQAAGLSRAKIVISALKTVIPVMFLIMLLGEYVAPIAEQKAHDIKTSAISGGKITASTYGIWVKEGHDFISIDTLFRDGSLRGVTLYRFNLNGELQEVIRSAMAVYQQQAWHLKDIVITQLQDKQQIKFKNLTDWVWKTNLTPDKLGVVSVSPDELSAQGLYNYISYMKSNGQQVDDYELEFWRKLLAPVSVIAMLLLAASTIFGPLRSVSMGARLISGVMMGFAFFVANQVLGPFSLVYNVPPVIGASVPSLIFMGVAIYMLQRRT
ncbi:permease YjgP/YjgQ family protein [Tolumonas auensis DSM 9187]|uniref:Permease YjgP/YjgQ family protein n=1 Tax=Tolumonas auensis (strain DSM 9187 / NBRC 110442 / TA 4) TaxID=595494 RepID=C4LA49_TOLAT|nr:LPS export ABC transporter permease LptG [Tolumonas auensis]ACQ92178.1 permease YjgP/YjgQ family protein [Tolumonas auensis DSM 9187]